MSNPANYEYIVKLLNERTAPGDRILDYGCGKGAVVELALERGLEIYGAEAFDYGSGTNIRDHLHATGLLGNRVKEIDLEHHSMPFPSDYFDCIVSNQVFEHVKDIEATLAEISRVAKAHAKIILIFPSKEAVREGHCNVLFAHWIPKSRLRYLWLLFNRCCGLGRLKRGRTKRQWAAFFNEWLVDNVTYRSTPEIHHAVHKFFPMIEHIEEDYMAFRLSRTRWRSVSAACHRFPINRVARLVCRKWGSLVFVARTAKPEAR